ncbi:MAG: histidine phosphatase family protein [Nitrospinae bacterium]|nr:histidine phosphatase family protein [Nitrospinota bacterium]
MNQRRADSTVSMPRKAESTTRVLLLRHGAAEGSKEGFFYGSTDAPLLAEGEAQVREAAARVKGWLMESETAIYASSLTRSVKTAEILSEAMGLDLKPVIVPDISELHLGDWEGETHASLSNQEPERLAEHYRNFVNSKPPGGGESVAELAGRVLPAFRDICDREKEKNVIVCAHAAVNRVILCDALGAPLESFFRLEQDFAALNVIDLHENAPLVRSMNI